MPAGACHTTSSRPAHPRGRPFWEHTPQHTHSHAPKFVSTVTQLMVETDQQIKQIRFRSLDGFPTTDPAVVFDRVGASTVRFRNVAVFAPLCGIARLRRRCAPIHCRASERRGEKTRRSRVRIAGAILRKRAPKRRGRAPDGPARRAVASSFPFYTAFTLTTGELNARPPLEMRRSNSPAATLNFPAPPTEGGDANV